MCLLDIRRGHNSARKNVIDFMAKNMNLIDIPALMLYTVGSLYRRVVGGLSIRSAQVHVSAWCTYD